MRKKSMSVKPTEIFLLVIFANFENWRCECYPTSGILIKFCNKVCENMNELLMSVYHHYWSLSLTQCIHEAFTHNTQDTGTGCYLHPRGDGNKGYNILLNPGVCC